MPTIDAPPATGQPLAAPINPPLVETPNPNETGDRAPGDPTVSLNPDGTPANAPAPISQTVPPNPAPTPTSDPAFVPSPMQQMPPVAATDDAMDSDEGFQKFYAANIYNAPGSHAGDHAFKVWLYNVYKGQSGGSSPAPAVPSTQPASTTAPTTTPSTTEPASTPAAAAPTVTSIAPDSAFANHDLDLVVTGTGFDTGAKIVFAGVEQTSTVTDTTSVKATVPAASIQNPGTSDVSVKNSDGTESNKVTFTAT